MRLAARFALAVTTPCLLVACSSGSVVVGGPSVSPSSLGAAAAPDPSTTGSPSAGTMDSVATPSSGAATSARLLSKRQLTAALLTCSRCLPATPRTPRRRTATPPCATTSSRFRRRSPSGETGRRGRSVRWRRILGRSDAQWAFRALEKAISCRRFTDKDGTYRIAQGSFPELGERTVAVRLTGELLGAYQLVGATMVQEGQGGLTSDTDELERIARAQVEKYQTAIGG